MNQNDKHLKVKKKKSQYNPDKIKIQNVSFEKCSNQWDRIYRGINLDGVCKNNQCKAYNKRVWIPRGFGKFHLNNQSQNPPCPICKKSIQEIILFGFYDCKYSLNGIYKSKQDGKNKRLQQIKSTPQNTKIVTFNLDLKLIEWQYLQINVVQKNQILQQQRIQVGKQEYVNQLKEFIDSYIEKIKAGKNSSSVKHNLQSYKFKVVKVLGMSSKERVRLQQKIKSYIPLIMKK